MTSLGDFVHAGVGILIHARWTSSVTKFCRISDRLLYVDVKLHGKLYKILAIYVPPKLVSMILENVYWTDKEMVANVWLEEILILICSVVGGGIVYGSC